ncbi:hypothetical protein AgCh_034446 [Apium graveolens]
MGRADAGLDDTRKLIDATRGEVEFVHKSADGYPGRLDLDLDKPFMSSMEHWVQKTTYDNTGPRYKNLQDHTQNVYNDKFTLYHSGCYWHIISLQGGVR